MISINQQLVRDFDSEERGEQVDQGSEVGLFYGRKSGHGHGTKTMIWASHSAMVKPCRSAWVEVKDFDDPSIEGTPQLLHTLIKKGLNLFDHQGFLGKRRGGRRRILLANKSYLPFQVNRGQRLGVMETSRRQ